MLCTAIYSGDYKWFETESEEELESESPTGSPSRDRSHSPNEPERDRAETKETEDKGLLFFCKYYKNTEHKPVALIMHQ